MFNFVETFGSGALRKAPGRYMQPYQTDIATIKQQKRRQ